MKREPPIQQWARILWLDRYDPEVNLIALLYAAYFDASGEYNGKYTVLSVGGAVAPVKKWVRFVPAWNKVLAGEGVTEFHATDFAASAGEYAGWKNDKPRRTRFLNSLAAVMKRDTNKFFSASCELEAWDKVNRDFCLAEFAYSPYALCGFTVVKQVTDWAARKRIPRENLKIIFEDGDDGWAGLKTWCNRIGIEPVRLPKAEAIPCQVGDWVGWKSRIGFANATEKFDKFMAMTPPTIEAFHSLMNEGTSMDRAMIRPGKAGVYSEKVLRENCIKFGVAERLSETK